MTFDKKALRHDVRERISQLDPTYIAESNTAIRDTLLSLREIKDAPVVFLYHSMGREVDTLAAIDSLLEMGKTVALPVCQKGGIMYFVPFDGKGKKGLLGITEPEGDTELVPKPGTPIVVPALAYDADGYRLGQGGGYYDRYLATHNMFAIGVGREALLLDKTPVLSHDMPVNLLITEKRCARLR